MEPLDRICDLGDASVPFAFDVHVMMFSDNAPELEGALHDLLESRRVNMVNRRKEFYRDVDLGEVEKFVKKRGLSAQFVKVRGFRRSSSLEQKLGHPGSHPSVSIRKRSGR